MKAATKVRRRTRVPRLPELTAPPAMDEPLLDLRRAIDEIDRRLVALLSERARLAQRVGELKHAAEAPVYRPEREAEVLRNVAAANPGPLSGAAPPGALLPGA